MAKVTQAERDFAENQDDLIYPRQEIPVGASAARWRAHGYTHYYKVFTARQIIAFNYLFEAIRAIPDRAYQEAFYTIFSNMLEYNNMMTPYNYPHRKLHHLFNYHALPLTTTPVENVVWGAGRAGAGTFVNCYRRYVNAKSYCQQPYDKFKNGQKAVQTIYAQNEHIEGHTVSSYAELSQQPRGVWLHCGDSAHLADVPDNAVDFVITDPPYFDNIHYSELANFFYVWLAQFALNEHFGTSHVDATQEAIGNAGLAKGAAEFRDGLTAVFRECARVLKPGGKLIFTFHHSKWRAWWTVLQAIMNGGFRAVDYFPVTSEYKVNPHIRDKQAWDMDLVIVCEHRPATGPHKPIWQLYEQITTAARARFGAETTTAPVDSSKLFLYGMGELLIALSVLPTAEDADYELFASVLTRYVETLEKIPLLPAMSPDIPDIAQQPRLL